MSEIVSNESDEASQANSAPCATWKEYTDKLNHFLLQYHSFVWWKSQTMNSMPSNTHENNMAPLGGRTATLSQYILNNIHNLQNTNANSLNNQIVQWRGGYAVVSLQTQRINTRTYKKAPIVNRFLADVLDTVFLLVLKIFVSLCLSKGLVEVSFDAYDKFFQEEELSIEDLSELIGDLIVLEIFHRVSSCVYEMVHIAGNRANRFSGGATPGKQIMGLRVVHYDKIFALANDRIMVTNPANPGYIRALVRSIIKNLSMAFLIPTPLSACFSQYGLAFHDSLTKTLVVSTTD